MAAPERSSWAGDARGPDMSQGEHFELPPIALRAAIASGVFDERFYLSTYPDIAAAGVDPLEHYLAAGRFEGRRPSAIFDPAGLHRSESRGGHFGSGALRSLRPRGT